jgi:gliding motility-associated-like protein
VIDLGEDRKLCPGESVELYNLTASNVALTWNTGETGAFIEADMAGVYSVLAYDGYCESRDSVYVGFGGVNLGIIPNIITPNNDLVNDELIIESENLIGYHLIITNRWGNPVFETSDSTHFWDGRSQGAIVDDGVYYYLLHYECEGVEKKKSGFVQVQR